MTDANQVERSIRVVPFSGKSSDWTTWEETFLARAKQFGYKDILLGKIEVPKEKTGDGESKVLLSSTEKETAIKN